MDFKQLHTLVIVPTLLCLEPEIKYKEKDDKIVTETLWHESECFTCIAQRLNSGNFGAGSGLGMTERPTWNWLYGRYQALIHAKVPTTGSYLDLYWNNKLAVIMCRLRYLVVTEPIPELTEGLDARAVYWGKWYQTGNDPVKIELYKKHARLIPTEPFV